MQFDFNCQHFLKSDENGYVLLDARRMKGAIPTRSGVHLSDQVARIIDDMGYASSKSQGLKSIITTSSKFISSDNRLFLRICGKTVIGLLKVGVKKLFIRNQLGQIKEISPLCVLDFYVHQSAQRSGQGRALFDKMLQAQSVRPEKLAYDRPSPKLMGFLRKHFNLSRFIPQNNNFVVFSSYFDSLPSASSSSYAFPRRDSNLNKSEIDPQFNQVAPSSSSSHSYRGHSIHGTGLGGGFRSSNLPTTVNKDTFANIGLQISSGNNSNGKLDISLNSIGGAKKIQYNNNNPTSPMEDIGNKGQLPPRYQQPTSVQRSYSKPPTFSHISSSRSNYGYNALGGDSARRGGDSSSSNLFNPHPMLKASQTSNFQERKIQQMDAKISRTEQQIARCEQQIRHLEIKNSVLYPHKQKPSQQSPKVSQTKITPNGFDMLYNKRIGYATVYGNQKNGFQDSTRGQDHIYSNQTHMHHMKKTMHHGSRPPWATYQSSVPSQSMYPTQSSNYGMYFRKV